MGGKRRMSKILVIKCWIIGCNGKMKAIGEVDMSLDIYYFRCDFDPTHQGDISITLSDLAPNIDEREEET